MRAGAVRSQLPVRSRRQPAGRTAGLKPMILELSQFSADSFPVRVRKLRLPAAVPVKTPAGGSSPVVDTVEPKGILQGRRRIIINSIDVIPNSNIVSQPFSTKTKATGAKNV